jgi:hypothetical protein
MGKQVRFYITWTFNRDMVPGAFHSEADHLTHAQNQLVSNFEGYTPSLETSVCDLGDWRTKITMIWDVTLDAVHGAWHTPDMHLALLERVLAVPFLRYNAVLDVETYQLADKTSKADDIDHGNIMTRTNGLAIKDDYPMFRPVSHIDWPEANGVFLQDGGWWWCVVDANGEIVDGPAVGEEPVAIYMPYTDMPVCYAA